MQDVSDRGIDERSVSDRGGIDESEEDEERAQPLTCARGSPCFPQLLHLKDFVLEEVCGSSHVADHCAGTPQRLLIVCVCVCV